MCLTEVYKCNILVDENASKKGFTALIADFGTAYFVDGATDPSVKKTIFKPTSDQVGNVGWLSPELLRRKEVQEEEAVDTPIISIPGDIYSFGCVSYEVSSIRMSYIQHHSEFSAGHPRT